MKFCSFPLTTESAQVVSCKHFSDHGWRCYPLLLSKGFVVAFPKPQLSDSTFLVMEVECKFNLELAVNSNCYPSSNH